MGCLVRGSSIGAVSIVNLLLDSGHGLFVELGVLENCFSKWSANQILHRLAVAKVLALDARERVTYGKRAPRECDHRSQGRKGRQR